MSKYNIYPKPLKGNQLLSDENDLNVNLDGIELNNVIITGGSIDGVIIGANSPSDAFFNNITVYNNTSTQSISDIQSIIFNNGGQILETNTNNIIINPINNTIIDSTLQVNDNTIIDGDLTVYGTIFGVPVAPPLNLTIENITTNVGTSIDVSNLYNITFLAINPGVGTITTGNLNVASFDGYYKFICIANVPSGTTYELTIYNLLDPFSGTISNKVVKFKYSGQSITLMYSLNNNCYFLIPAGSV